MVFFPLMENDDLLLEVHRRRGKSPPRGKEVCDERLVEHHNSLLLEWKTLQQHPPSANALALNERGEEILH